MRLAARIYQAKREKVIRVLFKIVHNAQIPPVSTVLRVDSPIQELRMSSIHVYRTAVEFSESLIHKVSYSPRRLAVPESGTLAVQFNLLCLRHPADRVIQFRALLEAGRRDTLPYVSPHKAYGSDSLAHSFDSD